MMRNTQKIFIKFISLLILLSYLKAFNQGTTPLAFLKINTSPKATALGEAFTAISNGSECVFWNPSRLVFSDGIVFSSHYTLWIENIYIGSLYMSFKTSKFSSFGFGIQYLGMDYMKSYNDDGEEIANETHTSNDILIALSYSRIIKKIPLGVTIKFIQEMLADVKATTFNFDFGISYILRVPKLKKLHLACSIKNIGPMIKFKKENFLQPTALRLGIGYLHKNFTLASDLYFPIDNVPSIHFGFEYILWKILALRTGYKTNTILGLGFLSGLTVGFGIDTKSLSFDYALSPLGELGLTHKFSFSLKFK